MRPMRYAKRALRILVVGCAVLVTLGATHAKSFDRELDATAGERLVVKLETGAAIEIVGWSRDAVAVEAEFTGRDSDNIEFEVERTSTGVRVVSEFSESRKRQSSGGRVRIQVPHRFDLEIETSGGEIRIQGVEGNLRGETMGGELVLEDLRGELDLSTMGGEVRLEDSEVDGRVSTMGGNVLVKNVCGSVETTTMGGDVKYDNVADACGGACRNGQGRSAGHDRGPGRLSGPSR